MSAPAQLIAVLVMVGLAAAYLAWRAFRRIKFLLSPGEGARSCGDCRGGCAGKPIRDLRQGCDGRGGPAR